MRSKTRKSKQKGGEDFSGQNLAGKDFSGQNLAGSNFKEAILERANFTNADLTDAILEDADLTEADLTGANLQGTNLRGANLSMAYLSDAKGLTFRKLINIKMNGIKLKKTNLTGSILEDVILNTADLTNANFTRANLENADLRYTDLSNSNFTDANLTGANLSYCGIADNTTPADFTGANLTGSILTEIDLNACIFKKVNLTGAILKKADLKKTDLTDANLTGADLTEADLTGANLTGANLTNAEIDKTILKDITISKNTNFKGTKLEKINILKINDKSKSKKNLANIVSFFRKTKIYKPLIKKIYDGILNDSIQIDNNNKKKIENILSNKVINSIVNNNEDFINIFKDKELLNKNVKNYTSEEINKIITALYKEKKYKKKLEALLSRTNLSNEEKLLIEAITNKTNIIPTLITDKSKYNNVYYDPIIGQYIFIIPAGTLFFRGSQILTEKENIPEYLYTYSVPTMCFGVKGFNIRYNAIYVVKAIKDLKFIISILPAPKSRHNLRFDKLIFSNNERSKNLSELQGNILYSITNDPSLHKDIRKNSDIDGIISIAGMDSFYDGFRKELQSMSNWLKRSVQLGIPTEYYISHMNIDSSSNIGYPEYVIYSDNNDPKNNANTKIEYIMTISSAQRSDKLVIELCEKLLEYLRNTRGGDLYWDKRTGNFFDFKGYNKNEKYFTKYDTDLTLKDVLLEIDGDITTILNNSKPLEGTLTKIQYITKDLCNKIDEIITTNASSSVLSSININNKKFRFPNRTNFSGGQELNALSMNEAYARYLIPTPESLFDGQKIEDFL